MQYNRPISTPFGSVQDNLRDLHIKGTVPPGVTPEINTWHPFTGVAAEACVESLYYLGTPAGQDDRLLIVSDSVYPFNLASLAGPSPYYLGLNLDIEIMSGGVLYGPISIIFTPGSGVLPLNPDTWRPSHIRQFIHNTIVAAGVLPLAPNYCTLSNEDTLGVPGDSGRLRIWCRNTQPGDYIRILDTTDDLVYDILGFYPSQIAYCPQPVTIGDVRSAMFDLPGALELGLELMNPGDSFYYEVVNRSLINLGEDLRTLRSQVLHLRDGVFSESDIPVQAGFTGVKRFHDDVQISWGQQVAREFSDLQPRIYLDYLAATMPSGARVTGSPATWVQTDQLSGSNRLFGIEFDSFTEDWNPFGGGGTLVGGWSYIAEVHNLSAVPPFDVATSLFGSQFMMTVYSDTADGVGGGSTLLTERILPAIAHFGYVYSHQVYNKWQPPYGTAWLFHSGEAYYVEVNHTNLGMGSESEFGFRPERTDTVPGFMGINGGRPEGGFYYRLQFSNSPDAYTFGFQHRLPWLGAAPKPAYYYEGITFYNETLNGALRYEQTHFDNLHYNFSIEDRNSILGGPFLAQLSTQQSTEWYTYTVPATPPSSFFLWKADGQTRAEIEGASGITPYALRLGQPVAPGPVTQLVWSHDAVAKTLIKWRESTNFHVDATIDAVNNYGSLNFYLSPYSVPHGISKIVFQTPSDQLFAIMEIPAASLGMTGTDQAVVIGKDGSVNPKSISFANGKATGNSADDATIAWNLQNNRPGSYTAGENIGALRVHRGGDSLRELNGELADYYRVFTPYDYWWDAADAIENSWGTITLNNPLPSPPPPSWTLPIPLRSGSARGPLVCWVIESLGGNVYKYIMEGKRVQTGDVVCLPDGTNYTVVSVALQPKGTILFKSGQYMVRHRLTFAAPFGVGYFAVGAEVVQQAPSPSTTWFNARGTIVEVSSARTWIDVIMSVGHWQETCRVDRAVAPGVPATISAVRYPLDIQTKMHREGAHLHLLGEDGVTFVTHASLLRLSPTAASGIDIDYLMDDNGGLARGFQRKYGSDLGLTFENITFGGFIPYNDAHFGGSAVSYDNHNEHGVVLYQFKNIHSYYYGLKFESCHFMDRVAWFNDYAVTAASEVRYELEMDVLNSTIDPEFFLGHVIGAAYLVDMRQIILHVGSFKIGAYGRYPIANTTTARTNETFGPAIVRSTFQNIRVTMPAARPTNSSGSLRSVVPFSITSLVDTIFDNIVEVYLPEQETAIGWTVPGLESSAWCDYFANVTIRDCDWPGQFIQLGAIYASYTYTADISAALTASTDYLVTDNGFVGQVFATSAGNTIAELRLISLGVEGQVPTGSSLIWVTGSKWLDHNPAITISAWTLRAITSGGVKVTQSRIGHLRVHGAGQEVDPSGGSIWSGHDDNEVVVSKCTFFSAGRSTPLRSNLITTGTLGDFLICRSITWEHNHVQRLSWAAVSTDEHTRFQQGASAHLVGVRCCKSFRAYGNEYYGKNATTNAIRPAAPTLGATTESRCGTSLFVYQSYLTETVEIERDRGAYLYAGDAACGVDVSFAAIPAHTPPVCAGGDFYFAALCYVHHYRIHNNELNYCGSGYGAGANGVYTRPGFVGIVADLNLPGDTVNPGFQAYFGDDTVDYMGAYLIEPPVWNIDANVYDNNLYRVVSPRGANISELALPPAHDVSELDANCAYTGMGGWFAAWIAGSNYPPTTPLYYHARTWTTIKVDKNKFIECAAGDGGSVSAAVVGDFSGGDGGSFYGVLFSHRGEASYQKLSCDDNNFISCVVGNGQDAQRPGGVGNFYGGMGGDFAAVLLKGGEYKLSGYDYWFGLTCHHNTFAETMSGSAGIEQGSATYAGFVGSLNLVRMEVGLNAIVQGVSLYDNGMDDCWPGTGLGGLAHKYTAGVMDNYMLKGLSESRYGASWSLLSIKMPSVAAVLGIGIVHGRGFEVKENRVNTSLKSAPASQVDTFFSLCHVECDIPNASYPAYPAGSAYIFPYRTITIANNDVCITPNNNDLYSAVFIYTNQREYILNHLHGGRVIIDNNNISVERVNPNGRFSHDFLILPWHQQQVFNTYNRNLLIELDDTAITQLMNDCYALGVSANMKGIVFGGTDFIATDERGHPHPVTIATLNSFLSTDHDFNQNLRQYNGAAYPDEATWLEANLSNLAMVIQHAFQRSGIAASSGYTLGYDNGADIVDKRLWVRLDRGPWAAITQIGVVGVFDFTVSARLGGSTPVYFTVTSDDDGASVDTASLTLDGFAAKTWYCKPQVESLGLEAFAFEIKGNT